jgi:hypothetical protein
VLVVEQNFTEFSSECAHDDFRKHHESGLQLRRHGEVAPERASAVSGADPGAEDEGVTTVECDGWLDED